jgi:hypothetical protein
MHCSTASVSDTAQQDGSAARCCTQLRRPRFDRSSAAALHPRLALLSAIHSAVHLCLHAQEMLQHKSTGPHRKNSTAGCASNTHYQAGSGQRRAAPRTTSLVTTLQKPKTSYRCRHAMPPGNGLSWACMCAHGVCAASGSGGAQLLVATQQCTRSASRQSQQPAATQPKKW